MSEIIPPAGLGDDKKGNGLIILPFETEDKEKSASTAMRSEESEPLTLDKLEKIFCEFALDHKTIYFIGRVQAGRAEIKEIPEFLGAATWGIG